jgi:hypothetical protein
MTTKAIPIPVPVTVSDPDNVPETLVTGPISLIVGPELSTLIVTKVRPDFGLLMKGQVDPNPQAAIAAKIIFPTSQIRGLHASIGQGLANLDAAIQANRAAPNGGIVVPGGESSH